jgi:hypothetical protein
VIAVNKPHEIVGIIPALLPDKEWRVEIRTQFSSPSTLLKEIRTKTSDFTVSV